MTGRGAKWPKRLKMAKNQQNRAFYAKNQLFDYFQGKLTDKCECLWDTRVSENICYFMTHGGHFESSRYKFEGFLVLESKSLLCKCCLQHYLTFQWLNFQFQSDSIIKRRSKWQKQPQNSQELTKQSVLCKNINFLTIVRLSPPGLCGKREIFGLFPK